MLDQQQEELFSPSGLKRPGGRRLGGGDATRPGQEKGLWEGTFEGGRQPACGHPAGRSESRELRAQVPSDLRHWVFPELGPTWKPEGGRGGGWV